MIIYHDDPPNRREILEIKDALNITVAVVHFLGYHIQTFPGTADGSCTVVISAPLSSLTTGAVT